METLILRFSDYKDGPNVQYNGEVLTGFGAWCLVNPYAGDGFDDSAVSIALAHQVNDLNCNVFNRAPVQPGFFCGLHKKKKRLINIIKI